MNVKFELIDCYDDLISFYEPEQTFKIGKLLEKIKREHVSFARSTHVGWVEPKRYPTEFP